MTKYLIILHSEGCSDCSECITPARIIVCNTPEERERATTLEINGDAETECRELETLRQDKIVHFEGDPSVEWVDGAVEGAALQLLEKVYAWLHNGPMDSWDTRTELHQTIGDYLGKPRVAYGE